MKFSSNLGAVDLGNSLFKGIINGDEVTMPHATALCTDETIEYYDPKDYIFEESLVVEIDSGALHNRREKQYVGISATGKSNQKGALTNNQKVKSDDTLYLLLTMLAYPFAKNAEENSIEVEYDVVSTALPTKQVKRDREELRKRIKGFHTIVFKHIPGKKDIYINLNIKNVIVSEESRAAFIALTRDNETLTVKDETLLNEHVLMADLGGDSFDPVALNNNKIIEDKDIQGETFGINVYLNRIINDIETKLQYRFLSRYMLEERLAQGPASWSVTIDQEEHDFKHIVDPHFKELAERYINELEQLLKVPSLQEVRRIFAIGGAVKMSKTYIEEANNKREKPFKINFPNNLDKLNLEGLWILAKIQAKVNELEVAASKDE